MSSSIKAVLVFLLQTDVFTLNVQVAVGKIPALVLVSSDKTVIQEQILAETTSQTKDSQATALVALMETLQTCGDSASLQKYVTRQFWTLLGSSRITVLINHEHMAHDI
ncbi:hypothetical protein BASA83_001107 [Batrachochytrium salamandrivorans]|nr:hypothetical protein BASA83_001107 [Batrachochytrium salamandrivorans]